jgi:O-antigen ligase
MEMLVVAGALLVVVFVFALASKDRVRAGRRLLWAGFYAPSFTVFFGTQAGASSQNLSVAPSDALTFGLPLACTVLGTILSRPLRRGVQWPEVLILGFGFLAAISAVWSEAPTATLMKSATLLVSYITILAVVRRYRDVASTLRALASFVQVTLLLALISAAISAVIAEELPARLTGVFPSVHPNIVGLLAVVGLISVVCGIGLGWVERSVPARVLLGFVFVSELLLARTRLALVVAVIAVGVALIRLAVQRRSAGLALLLAVAIAPVLLATQLTAVTDFLVRGQTEDQLSSLSGRVPLWDSAFQLWQIRPLQGFGYYTGHRVTLQPLFVGADQSNIDNMWVETLVNLGVIGAILLALVIAVGAVRTLGALRDPGVARERIFAHASLLALVAATFFNPSLQTTGFPAVMLGVLLLSSFRSRPAIQSGGLPGDGVPARRNRVLARSVT